MIEKIGFAGMFKARVLAYTAIVAGTYQAIVGDGWIVARHPDLDKTLEMADRFGKTKVDTPARRAANALSGAPDV